MDCCPHCTLWPKLYGTLQDRSTFLDEEVKAGATVFTKAMSFESFESFILFDLSFRVNSSIQESSSQASRDQFLWAAGSTVDHASSMKSSERLVPRRQSGKVRLGVFLLFSTQSFMSVFVCKMLWKLWTQKIWCQMMPSCSANRWPLRVGWLAKEGRWWRQRPCPHKHGSSAQHYDTPCHLTSLAMTTLQAQLPRLPTMFLDQTLSWLTTSDGKANTVTWRSGDAGNHWTLDYPARISRLCLWTLNIF